MRSRGKIPTCKVARTKQQARTGSQRCSIRVAVRSRSNSHVFSVSLVCFVVSVLEWEFAELGMLDCALEEDPRIRIENARKIALRAQQEADESDSDDD